MYIKLIEIGRLMGLGAPIRDHHGEVIVVKSPPSGRTLNLLLLKL
jgi:hypothetical protein